METRIIVVAVICDKNKILLGKKSKRRPPYPDVWHTLGGGVIDFRKALDLIEKKLFDHQYFYDELRREIREEANIEIKNIKSIYPKYRATPREAITENKKGIKTHYVFLEYICDFAKGDFAPGDDIAKLLWINRDKLETIKLTPPSIEMYHELGWIK